MEWSYRWETTHTWALNMGIRKVLLAFERKVLLAFESSFAGQLLAGCKVCCLPLGRDNGFRSTLPTMVTWMAHPVESEVVFQGSKAAHRPGWDAEAPERPTQSEGLDRFGGGWEAD